MCVPSSINAALLPDCRYLSSRLFSFSYLHLDTPSELPGLLDRSYFSSSSTGTASKSGKALADADYIPYNSIEIMRNFYIFSLRSPREDFAFQLPFQSKVAIADKSGVVGFEDRSKNSFITSKLLPGTVKCLFDVR